MFNRTRTLLKNEGRVPLLSTNEDVYLSLNEDRFTSFFNEDDNFVFSLMNYSFFS